MMTIRPGQPSKSAQKAASFGAQTKSGKALNLIEQDGFTQVRYLDPVSGWQFTLGEISREDCLLEAEETERDVRDVMADRVAALLRCSAALL